jgi:hypothetical protein
MFAAILAVLLLAACDTQPATDVASRGATLNSKGSCASGGAYGGTNQYQLRDASAGSSFFDVGPRYRFDCNGGTGEVALNAFRPTNLNQSTTYQFRLVSRLDNGSVQTWDSVGTNGGTNYDQFRTPSDHDWSITCANDPNRIGCEGTYQTEGGSDGGAVTSSCDDGTTACAASAQKKCKGRDGNPLTNVYRSYDYWIKSREAKVETDWCWKDGKVVERHSVPSALVTQFGSTLGQFVNRDDGRTEWKYSACTADMSTCLTRYQATFSCCFDDETPINVYNQAGCIGTRICAYACGENGAYHSRNIIRGSCP